MRSRIFFIGGAVLTVGAFGVVFFTVAFLPLSGKLGAVSPACFLGICISSLLYRILSASFFLVTIFGLGLVLIGSQLRDFEKKL